MKAFLKFAAIVVVAIFLGTAAVVHFYLDSIVKTAAEKLGPPLIQAPLSLGRVSLSPLFGKGTLRDVVVGNPKGFHSPHAVKIGRIYVYVSLRSLLTDTIVVRRVEIDDPDIAYETGFSGSNITRLQRNVETAPSASASGKPAKAAKGKERKVMIDDVVVRGGKIRLAAQMIKGELVVVPLPDIHLTGIGRKSGGATVQDALSQITAPIAKAIGQAAAGGGQAVGQSLNKILKGLFGNK